MGQSILIVCVDVHSDQIKLFVRIKVLKATIITNYKYGKIVYDLLSVTQTQTEIKKRRLKSNKSVFLNYTAIHRM